VLAVTKSLLALCIPEADIVGTSTGSAGASAPDLVRAICTLRLNKSF
jgi:hypothetical protein